MANLVALFEQIALTSDENLQKFNVLHELTVYKNNELA